MCLINLLGAGTVGAGFGGTGFVGAGFVGTGLVVTGFVGSTVGFVVTSAKKCIKYI